MSSLNGQWHFGLDRMSWNIISDKCEVNWKWRRSQNTKHCRCVIASQIKFGKFPFYDLRTLNWLRHSECIGGVGLGHTSIAENATKCLGHRAIYEGMGYGFVLGMTRVNFCQYRIAQAKIKIHNIDSVVPSLVLLGMVWILWSALRCIQIAQFCHCSPSALVQNVCCVCAVRGTQSTSARAHTHTRARHHTFRIHSTFSWLSGAACII